MNPLSGLKRKYLNITGKIEEKWPVKLRVYREIDDGQYILSQETRGRSLRENDDQDRVKLEIMDSNLETREVPYKYFTNRRDGIDELEVVRHTRTSFSPLNLSINTEQDDGTVEKIYDIEEMKRTALDDFQQKTNVVEIENEKWYNNTTIQAVILFMGAGIFFVLLGIGYSRVISQPILDKLNNLEGAGQAASGMIPVIGLAARNKANTWKEKISSLR